MYNKHVNVYTHTYTQFLYMEQASVGGVGTMLSYARMFPDMFDKHASVTNARTLSKLIPALPFKRNSVATAADMPVAYVSRLKSELSGLE